MKLKEVWSNFVPPAKGNYKLRHAIYKWLELRHIDKGVIVNDDMTVTVKGNVELKDVMKIPFQFKLVEGNFDISGSPLTTLKGCPYFVEGEFICTRAPIQSFEFAPQYVGYSFHANQTEIMSAQNIHKQVKRIRDILFMGTVMRNALGVLLMEELGSVVVANKTATKILNEHLRSKDIHMCQQALIDAGLPEYAKL